ncbi:hypothetical protein H072_2188 [Dactylellina haptotyla CBS 200.50]|uniref:Uncharacterized protein n=1 Tax=Dactylellina haptotyla (strain CBS 200.50) TaxID=1284197 RepID=S8ALS8_DACHA|nr:hypothetical protein H072_2188 [Dactylellina haptotyla CBS 200.50]
MPPITLNRRAIAYLGGAFLFILLLSGAVTNHVRPDLIQKNIPEKWRTTTQAPKTEPEPPREPFQEEIFPLAQAGKVPQINPKNIAKDDKHATPLLIGFTRNWYLLEQAVVSYLAAGWPADQIIVIDNSGVMDSNLRGLLSPRNPWYLNHTRLDLLGVSVKRTPTLLTFAQLQNFFINFAIEHDWSYYFWSHMDVVVIPKEYESPYKGFYERTLECVRATVGSKEKWALKFFAYDWLTMVNVEAMKDVGAWDTQIPYYLTDCDMYERLYMKNYTAGNWDAGHIYDVATHLSDLAVLFPAEGENNALDTQRFRDLRSQLERMMKEKVENKNGRNTWQATQDGGKGEPFWRNPKGFEKAIQFWIEKGRELFKMKWNYSECDLRRAGRHDGSEWTW